MKKMPIQHLEYCGSSQAFLEGLEGGERRRF